MNTKNLASYKKPYVTHKYTKKIRILLTNRCERNCSFCHNEGMAREQQQYLDLDRIRGFFREFKKISNRIVLTGGEPFLYPHLNKLVQELDENGFDITIDTAISELKKYYQLLFYVNDIHISILDYSKCDEFIENIKELYTNVPSLRVVINIPLYDEEATLEILPRLVQVAQLYGARLQLIKIFYDNQYNLEDWYHRWYKMIQFFDYDSLQLIDATERESSFITQDHVFVDFIDIPCEFAGKEFSRSSCLNEMDITITPNLFIRFCRWSPNTEYPLSQPDSFLADAYNALKNSMVNCKCGGAKNELLANGLSQYAIGKHYIWPPGNDSYLWKIEQLINFSQTSYFGKEGYIRSFENSFARYIGTSYALSLCSGAAAFYIACKALGLTENSKVVLPVYSYPGMITALIHLKAKVILCDVEPDTGNISVDAFRKLASPEISAVVITHLWGNPVNIARFQEICTANSIFIIEDGSHAFGAKINKKRIGSLSDIAFFSLQSNKAVYAGEGGIITTNNRVYYEKAIMYSMLKKRIIDCINDRNMLMDDESGWGLKLKMNPVGAIMAHYSLENLDEVNELRKENYTYLLGIISSNPLFKTSATDKLSDRVYYTFKLILEKKYTEYRDLFVDRLIRRGLDATTSSFRPLHKLNITTKYNNICNQLNGFPNADYYAKRVISFPSFTYEDKKLIEFYAKTVIEEANRLLEESTNDNSSINSCAYRI